MDRTTSSSESLPALPDLKGAGLDPKDALKHIEQLREYSEAVKKQGLSTTNAAQHLLKQHLQNVKSQQTIMEKLLVLGKATVKDVQAGEASIKTKIEETWEALGRLRDNANAEWTDGTGQSLDHLISDRRKKSKAALEIVTVFTRLERVQESLQSRADVYDKVAKEVKVYEKKLEAA
ncbi:putative phenylalanine ammonia-lyase [Colletotrichum sp. SAR 10_66]|nr:putative phenylalanine ammonia-lyase [Colletotrichum sp. SAR 10_66]